MDIEKEHSDYIKTAKIRYIFRSVEDMWKELTALFEETKVRYIPVIRADGELICLAYSRYWEKENSIAVLDEILSAPKGKRFLDFFMEYWKGFKIQIVGFNESAWKLFNIFKKNSISVKVKGTWWKQFCPEAILTYTEEDVKKICQIETEWENGENPPDNVLFMNIEPAYNTMVVREWRCYLEKSGILFQCIPIPQREDLQFFTLDEQFRWENTVSPYMNKDQWEDKEVRKHIPPRNEQGEHLDWQIWQQIDNCKQKKEVEIDGERVGYQEYGTGVRRVYLIGPCIVRGMFVGDEKTLGSYIYRTLKKKISDVKVICLSPCRGALVFFEDLIQKIMLREGDAVIYFNENVAKEVENMGYWYERDVDLRPVYNARKIDYFWNYPIHTNEIGNRYIGEYCVKEVLKNHGDYFNNSWQKCHLIQTGQALLAPEAKTSLEKYLERVKNMLQPLPDGKKGAVVMNCNPMTLGHLYLIKQALKSVDFLYIFVVEEDQSEIAFEDRIEMVRRAVNHLKNVLVIPSGKFVISYMTMPIYFEKEMRQDDIWDASSDLQIFCEKIAPVLEITVRFMGEEPRDKITKQYNDMLRELAPLYDISFIEIPRLKLGGEIVSAKNVRDWLSVGRFDLVERVTPVENREILQKYVGV